MHITGKNYKWDTSSSALEINLKAIRENCRNCLKETGVPIMAVVKANAYGFGAAVIAVAEEETGIEAFATARVSEAMVLKNAGITKDILIF